jgi:hypothetical protein
MAADRHAGPGATRWRGDFQRDHKPPSNHPIRIRGAMHHRCVRSRQRRREGSGGVVADIAKLSVGRETYYTRELATDHQQYLSGHGESPGRWYGAGASSLGLQGEASVAEFEAMFEGRNPATGDLLGRPTAATPCPPSTWSCGRPRASRSSTAWVTPEPGWHGQFLQRPAGPAGRGPLRMSHRRPARSDEDELAVEDGAQSPAPGGASGGQAGRVGLGPRGGWRRRRP